MMRMRIRIALWIGFLALLDSACGVKGPPVPPSRGETPPEADAISDTRENTAKRRPRGRAGLFPTPTPDDFSDPSPWMGNKRGQEPDENE